MAVDLDFGGLGREHRGVGHTGQGSGAGDGAAAGGGAGGGQLGEGQPLGFVVQNVNAPVRAGQGILGYAEAVGGQGGELAEGVLGGALHRSALAVHDAAAAGLPRVGGQVGIAFGDNDPFHRNAEGFGGDGSQGSVAAGNVHGAGEQGYGAVLVDADGGGRGAAAAAPFAEGQADAMPIPGFAGPADLFLDGLQRFHQPIARHHGAAHRYIALPQGVLHPQVVRINAQFVGNMIHMGFHGEGHIGDAGGAVGSHVDFVGIDAVGAESEVGNAVGANAVSDAGVGAGAQVGADIKDGVGLPRDNRPVVHHAGADIVGNRQAGAVHSEGFRAGVDQLDGAARFHRQQGGEGFKGQAQLGPEAAAQFHRDNADAGNGHCQHSSQGGAHLIRPLGRCVNDQAPVGLHIGDAGHRLQETLVNALGTVHILNDDVGSAESLFHIAPVGVQQGTDILPHSESVAFVGFQIRVDGGGVVVHSGEGVDHGGQILVFHTDEGDGFLGGGFVIGGHGRDGLADEVDHRAGHYVAVAEGAGAEADVRKVGAGDDGADAEQGGGAAGVNADDAGVAAVAGEKFAGQHTGQVDVGGVGGAPGDFVVGVHAGVVLPQNFEIGHHIVSVVESAGLKNPMMPPLTV